MATPELIAALTLLKFSLLCQHPAPRGREAGRLGAGLGSPLRCVALSPPLIHTQPLDLTLTISTLPQG